MIGCTLFNTLLEVINNININYFCDWLYPLLEVINNININLTFNFVASVNYIICSVLIGNVYSSNSWLEKMNSR